MSATPVNTAAFEAAVAGEGIVLVDFWADWCGPCKRFAPVYDASASRHPDVQHIKVDTEQERQLSEDAAITSIPTLMAFRDGILVYRQAGALPAPALEDLIEQVRALDMDDVRSKLETKARGTA